MASNEQAGEVAGEQAGKKAEVSRGGVPGVSRRGFLKGAAAAVATEAVLARAVGAADAPPAKTVDAAPADDGIRAGISAGATPITLTINGRSRPVTVEPRTTLLSAMRDRLEPALTGPKLVCDAGTCGACTVLLDGKPAYGCSLLAIDVVGRSITTVEGIGTPDKLSPVQQAFCEKDAMMCGFCTSGFVTTATGLLMANPDPTPLQIREGCKGNFCRCGTFPHVFQAVAAAADAMKKSALKV